MGPRKKGFKYFLSAAKGCSVPDNCEYKHIRRKVETKHIKTSAGMVDLHITDNADLIRQHFEKIKEPFYYTFSAIRVPNLCLVHYSKSKVCQSRPKYSFIESHHNFQPCIVSVFNRVISFEVPPKKIHEL